MQARPNQPTRAGGYNNLSPSSPGSYSAAKTKQSHSKKKSRKYSGLCYHPSSATDHHWSQNIGSGKPQVLNLSALRYESLSKPRKRGLRGNYEERNEFHGESEVKGKFGFQAGM